MDREETAAIAVARELCLPYASVENNLLQMEYGQDLHRLLPRDYAEKHAVLVMFRAGDSLAVATPYCADESLLRDISERTGLRLTPFVAPRDQVLRAIAESYR